MVRKQAESEEPMKIIKPGNTDPPWVGFKVICGRCRCEFQLEPGDQVQYQSDQRGGDSYIVACPTCRVNSWISVAIVNAYAKGRPQ